MRPVFYGDNMQSSIQPSDWSSTLACMKNIGRAIGWSATFIGTLRWRNPTSRARSTATSRGRARPWRINWGNFEILKLREEASQKLGDKFDLRAFQDEVLGNGALPLDVLYSEVTGWIDSQAK